MSKDDWLPPVIVPNSTDTVLVTFYQDRDGTIHHARFHIIAWKVQAESDGPMSLAHPITAWGSDSDPFCYEQRIGEQTIWIFPDDCFVDTFESARDHAKELIRQSTERQQEARAVAEALAAKARAICLDYIACLGDKQFSEWTLRDMLRKVGLSAAEAAPWIKRAHEKWTEGKQEQSA